MLSPLIIDPLILSEPAKPLTDRVRAALAVVRQETQSENKRFASLKPSLGFRGEALTDTEWKQIRVAISNGHEAARKPPAFRSLYFKRIDPLGPHLFRVGVMPSTHPPMPPTYETYVVSLSKHGDHIESKTTGRVKAEHQPAFSQY